MEVRPADLSDIEPIQAIYAHHVRTGLASFETEPPDSAELSRRYAQITEAGFPYLVAVNAGSVIGYAYASLFRTRAAYRFTVEDSVYVAPGFQGRGAGRMLLTELIRRCTAQGLCQMLAVIGDSDNLASIALHRACGFEDVGIMTRIGRKFDRWVDVVIMQRALSAEEPRQR